MPIIPDGFETPDGKKKITNSLVQLPIDVAVGGGVDIEMINGSGAGVYLDVGDVVILSSDVNKVRLLTSSDAVGAKKRILGAIISGGASGATVRVRVFGIANVRVDGVVAINDIITGTVIPTASNPSPMHGGIVDNSPTNKLRDSVINKYARKY